MSKYKISLTQSVPIDPHPNLTYNAITFIQLIGEAGKTALHYKALGFSHGDEFSAFS